MGEILRPLPPLPGVQINHVLDLLTPEELASVWASLTELVRVQREALRGTADVQLNGGRD